MRHLITEIQSLGVQVHGSMTGRKGGAGPAEGRAFLINGIPVSVPIAASYVSRSPFSLIRENDRYSLLKKSRPVAPVNIVSPPRFYKRLTEDGIPYGKIALLHGKDCLATTVLQQCVHWKNKKKCRFCATQASLRSGQTIAKKTPAQLVEVARAARDLDGVTHMVLTSGTADPPGSEISYLAECARAIKTSVALPVQVQIAPPQDLGLMDALKDAGVDSLGIHIESFDPDILAKMAPAKAEIGLAHYEKAWKKAVRLFGPNQVSSFIIAGLGETLDSIAWGSELLADLGVYPFVVPLRPSPGSSLQNSVPPSPHRMKTIYDALGRILQTKGISIRGIKAGCARCGACSAMASFERPPRDLICHSVRNREEQSRAFQIREGVFVSEQGMFAGSDLDDNDGAAVHLVAKHHDRIVGTVRIYQTDAGSCHWIGGRLAVEKEFRATRAGSALVKEAMKRVKKKGCRIFTAQIQEKNIPFFRKLGWQPTGPLTNHLGSSHQEMQANLDLVPKEMHP